MKPSYLFDVTHIKTGLTVVMSAESFSELYDLVREQFGIGAEKEVIVKIRSK